MHSLCPLTAYQIRRNIDRGVRFGRKLTHGNAEQRGETRAAAA